MIDVPLEQMRLLKELIAQQLPDAEIWAFGSRMDGTAKPYSDLDLVIVLDEKMPFDRYLRVRNAFDESELSFRVDVMDFHRLNPSFQKRIQDSHVVLSTAKTDPVITKSLEK